MFGFSLSTQRLCLNLNDTQVTYLVSRAEHSLLLNMFSWDSRINFQRLPNTVHEIGFVLSTFNMSAFVTSNFLYAFHMLNQFLNRIGLRIQPVLEGTECQFLSSLQHHRALSFRGLWDLDPKGRLLWWRESLLHSVFCHRMKCRLNKAGLQGSFSSLHFVYSSRKYRLSFHF